MNRYRSYLVSFYLPFFLPLFACFFVPFFLSSFLSFLLSFSLVSSLISFVLTFHLFSPRFSSYPPGERPYQCMFCGRSFTEHSSLRKHKLTHTGEKPHVCDICGKKFSQSGSRNTHRKRHADKDRAAAAAGQLIVQGDDAIRQPGPVQHITLENTSKRRHRRNTFLCRAVSSILSQQLLHKMTNSRDFHSFSSRSLIRRLDNLLNS